MKRYLTAVLFVLGVFGAAFAQSGRRVAPQPTPAMQAVVNDDVPTYSESKPLAPRRTPATIGFPRLGSDETQKPAANGGAESAPASDDPDILKIETNLITIPVSVYDRNGIYIPGLKQNDFKIFEDGKEQDIAYFGTTDKPFTVILMLDTSPSTAYKIEQIHDAAIAFINQLQPQDKVMVIEFNQSVKVHTEPTNDREEIYNAIRKSRFGGGTSIYEAVDLAFRKWVSRIEGRKAIVLFTDGVDTTSRRATYDSTVDEAQEADSLVFPVYFNTFFDNNARIGNYPPMGGIPGLGGGMSRGSSAAEYAVGKQYLTDLANYTGGRVFPAESGLDAAFAGIAEELRRQYNIGYVPKDEGKPGQRKEIRVRVDQPNVVVRARDSYIVGATAAAVAPAAKPSN